MPEPMEGLSPIVPLTSAEIPDGSVEVKDVTVDVLQTCKAAGESILAYTMFN